MATLSAFSSPAWPNPNPNPNSDFLSHHPPLDEQTNLSACDITNNEADEPAHDPHLAPPSIQSPNFDPSPPSLLHVSFNQDSGCFASGIDRGFRIYNCDPFREIFQRDFDHEGKPTRRFYPWDHLSPRRE